MVPGGFEVHVVDDAVDAGLKDSGAPARISPDQRKTGPIWLSHSEVTKVLSW